MNRRGFLLTLCLSAAARAQEGSEVLYFADGYHGGLRGHMPPGAWRDIVNRLGDFPGWKVSLEVEPDSWDKLRREDPHVYREVQRLLADGSASARLELVGGTFGQAFGWAFSGESNIRQLTRGLEIARRHFPGLTIETYAVQVPCWTSALPQILRSLGFTRAILKATTMFVGYTTGVDAEAVDWVGPDGSRIWAVPRYACEAFEKAEATEGPWGRLEFARKCRAAGIAHPAAMALQDLGWPAKPRAAGDHIRYVTWRDYMREFVPEPAREWRFTQEDIRCALPWGDRDVHRLAGQVRAAENRVLYAEKLAAMASALRAAPFPGAALERAWDQALWMQHHDAWNSRRWYGRVAGQAQEVDEICGEAIAAAAEALATAPAGEARPLRVINTLGADRDDLVEARLAFDPGTAGVRVIDSTGRAVPAQVTPLRGYHPLEELQAAARESRVFGWSYRGPKTGGMNAATVVFRARVPASGYSTYRVEPLLRPGSAGSMVARSGGRLAVDTGVYRIEFDPARGGAITSLVLKETDREFCRPVGERLFNEYRGYFIEEKRWRSSAEEPAAAEVIESGPVRTRIALDGSVGGCPFRTIATFVEGQRRVDFQTTFRFDRDTWIGDPWDMGAERARDEPRRSHYDTRWSLQAFFPVALDAMTIDKNCAFDVCRSELDDTFYQRFDEIKHNVIVNWVDLADRDAKHGLAVLSDRTTAYTHGPDHPFALVMAWGWRGGYWWGKTPLRGEQTMRYAIVPHSGGWRQADVWGENDRWMEPLASQPMPGPAAAGDEERSLLSVGGEGCHVSAVFVRDAALFVRLFNAGEDESPRVVTLHQRAAEADLVELDGRVIRPLERRPSGAGGTSVVLPIPRFGIRTLRFAGFDSPVASAEGCCTR